jgi:hypothetical protein
MADPPAEDRISELLMRAHEFDEMTRQSQRLRRWIEHIRAASPEWPSVTPDEGPQSQEPPKSTET